MFNLEALTAQFREFLFWIFGVKEQQNPEYLLIPIEKEEVQRRRRERY